MREGQPNFDEAIQANVPEKKSGQKESRSREEMIKEIEKERDDAWEELKKKVEAFKKERHYDDMTYGSIRGQAWDRIKKAEESGEELKLPRAQEEFKKIMDREVEIEDTYRRKKEEIPGHFD